MPFQRLGIELEALTSAHKLLEIKDLNTCRLEAMEPLMFAAIDREERSILETRVRYEGYIRRERERLELQKPFESRPIPEGFHYVAPSPASRTRRSSSAREENRALSAKPRGSRE